MWILTLVILFGGDYEVKFFPQESKYQCLTSAQEAIGFADEMKDKGIVLLAAGCAQVKDN